MLRTAASTALVFASVACSQGRVTEESAPAVPVAIVVSGSTEAEGAPKDMKAVRIEFGTDVQYRQSLVTSTEGGMTSTATVNGHPFEVVGNEIRIGPRRYGPVSVGDRVLIDKDGVHINGTISGPLP